MASSPRQAPGAIVARPNVKTGLSSAKLLMKAIILGNQSRSISIFWRVLMERMRLAGIDPVVCAPPGDADAEKIIRQTGAEIINYSLDRKGLNPFRDLATLRELKAIMAAQKPDMVFSSTIKPVIYGSIAAKALKVPGIFATITGLGYVFEEDKPHKKLIHLLGKAMYRHALKGIDGVYFQNRDDAALFSAQKILAPDQRVLFAPGTGVDLARFQPVPFPEGGPVFLLAGRLLEAKGIEDYARAAAQLKKKWPNARFQLLGIPEKGPGGYPLDRALAWQAKGALEYLGQTRDIRPYLAAAHVAVLPSWREGAPTALLEAIAMGRPCVATDVPGCREVVANGVNGWLCQVRDPASLGAAMEKFLKSPAAIGSMGGKSRRLAEEKFNAATVADGIIREMTRITAQKRSG